MNKRPGAGLIPTWGNDCLPVAPDLGTLSSVSIPPELSFSVATHHHAVSWMFPAEALFFLDNLCHLWR